MVTNVCLGTDQGAGGRSESSGYLHPFWELSGSPGTAVHPGRRRGRGHRGSGSRGHQVPGKLVAPWWQGAALHVHQALQEEHMLFFLRRLV